jgi:hypothetical protein
MEAGEAGEKITAYNAIYQPLFLQSGIRSLNAKTFVGGDYSK